MTGLPETRPIPQIGWTSPTPPIQPGPAARERPKLIGEILLERGLITEEQRRSALRAQKRQGGTIGRHLILDGAVTRLALYSALAEQWAAPLIDLVEQPIDERLVGDTPATEWMRRGWVPVERDADGGLLVATTVRLNDARLTEIAREYGAVAVRLRTTTDWDLTRAVQEACRSALVFGASERLASENDAASAKLGLRRWQKVAPIAIMVAVAIGLVLRPSATVVVLLAAANLLFLMNVGFKVLAGLRGMYMHRARSVYDRELRSERRRRGLSASTMRIPDSELPVYTILVPAYKEANIIEKLVRNLGALDYPKSKLEVLLLLEEDDHETIERVKQMAPPEYVRVLIVPPGGPQTKPRACNYGLSFASGEYVVIYDAEDQPQPAQLREVVAKFRTEEALDAHLGGETKPLVCVQAALNYFNADYNVLTRMFAVEYAHWFDSMLPGMDGTGVPIPLGGTSNHFATEKLIEVGAWDPYNVTEDADLGMRIAVAGGRVGVIESTTWEEACAQVGAWIKQRTRWIKGYMMTAAVNMRHPVIWIKRNGLPGMVSLFALILGTPIAFMLYPLVFGFTVITYLGIAVAGLHIPEWLLIAGTTNMVASNLLMIVFSGLAAWRRYNWRIAVFALLNPLYWLLHSIAAWRAADQMYFQPHVWEKTPHGLTEDHEHSSIVVS